MFHISLSFVVKVATSLEDKLAQTIPILKERTGPAIVYVTLQAQADEGARLLREIGLEARMYHAGMSNENRQSVQEYFMASDNGIVCITSPRSYPLIHGTYAGCCYNRLWVRTGRCLYPFPS